MTKINVDKYKLILSPHRIPFTALAAEPFDLREYLQDIEHSDDPNKPPLIKTKNTQVEMYKACADLEAGAGWTACFSADYDIGRPEAVAMQIMGMYANQTPSVVWVNLSDTKWYNEKQIREIANPNGISQTGLIVVTGLRWESDHVRYDKAIDVLREAPPGAARIIVGVGANPIAFVRHIGIAASRVLYLRNTKSVDL